MDASSALQPPCPQPFDSEPWRPFFETHQDFEFAEIILESGLDSKRVDALIKLINLCIEGKGQFTITNFVQLQSKWKGASEVLTPVRLHLLSGASSLCHVDS